jgi:hypothetical protein
MRVGDVAAGRAGDKGDVLDLTVVATSFDGYDLLEGALTEERVRDAFAGLLDANVRRYELPGLWALKFVIPGAMPGGVHATMHPGVHWQKGAIYVLLDLDVGADGSRADRRSVLPKPCVDADAHDA